MINKTKPDFRSTSHLAYSYGLDFVFPGTHQSVDVPKLINKYRKEVNPDVQVFLVQIAGYTDTIVPEYFDKTYILGGWGDGLFNYAARMIELNHNQSKQPSFSQ